MASTFHARSAEAYEQLMGRWSRRLAEPFLAFAGTADGEAVLDVGCGTGSLTDAILARSRPQRMEGIDYSEAYAAVAAARFQGRASIRQGDACALPYDTAAFDRALSLLVLHFVPQAEQAVAEMRRVTRPGGTVAATVWDGYGGFTVYRMFYDTAAALDPVGEAARRTAYNRPLARDREMAAAFRAAGLVDVEQAELHIRMTFADFTDFWTPIDQGEAALGHYVASLPEAARATFKDAIRAAYLAGEADGPRSFAAAAWACRGRVPG